MVLFPMVMTPAFRFGSATPWGGDGLRRWGKTIPDPCTGESLEISVLPGLESRARTGETLSALLDAHGEAMRGTQVDAVFPLLLKLINTRDWLSVQVHPDDAYAARHEGGKLGKSEAWVILDAEPGSQIVYGIRPGVTRAQLAWACKQGGDAVRACLNFVPVQPGDVFDIPAGMVHALGGGVTLMELQQSSDVTYRFYDWDRVDAQGNSRPLHIQKGLDVTDPMLSRAAIRPVFAPCAGGLRAPLIRERTFAIDRLRVQGTLPLRATPEHFSLLCALGDGRLTWQGGEVALSKGDCVFLPAQGVDVACEGAWDALLCWPR